MVIVDGGFMRGTDVVKAIALGAQVVGHRAPVLLRAGRRGRRRDCVRTLELLEDEIRIAMALLGVDRLGAARSVVPAPGPAGRPCPT